MRHLTKFLKITTLVFLISFSIIRPSVGLEDAIIAIVNDEVITLKDLRDYIRMTYVNLVAEGRTDSELKEVMIELEKNGINKLIEDKIIISRADEIGLELRDKAIDAELEKVKARYPSEQTFMEALINNGATVSDLRAKITDQLKIRFTINHGVKSKIYVNPNEVTRFYEENKSSFLKKERVNLQSIYIAYQDDKEASRAKANEALTKIKVGTEFAKVAEEYSESPSVGVIERGQLQEDIEESVFSLMENEHTDLIETGSGIYIFKLLSRVPADIATLQEVKERIQNMIYKKKFRERYQKWLTDLKQNAYIEIKQ